MILKYFGARHPDVARERLPARAGLAESLVWINVEFDTLAAAPADAPAGEIVQAQWTPIRLDGAAAVLHGRRATASSSTT